MAYSSRTIKDVLNMIDNGEMVLPALQRSYVWKEDQICFLFDSLMKRYPIGTFLLWKVEKAELADYVFNSFIRDIDLIDGALRGDAETFEEYIGQMGRIAPRNQALAVLDGQQRITSLRVGLTGSYRSRVEKARKDATGSDPVRHLCLNLLHPISNSKDDCYEFEFKSDSEADAHDSSHFWFKVSNIIDLGLSRKELTQYVRDLNIHTDADPVFDAIEMLQLLYDVVWTDQPLSYYEAVNMDLSEVVEIFERINNNGKPLSGTDLVLSMTSATNKSDMQRGIFEAIKRIENATDDKNGFIPDREFILTASLMAIDATTSLSTAKAQNRSAEIIDQINDNWTKVIDAIETAAVYVEKLGFKGNKLGKSYLQPIVYYFFRLRGDKKEPIDADKYYQNDSANAQSDRANITQWILRAQIKQIFAYGIPSTLISIRNTMKKTMVGTVKDQFPLGALIQAGTGEKSLVLSSNDVDDILNWGYGNVKVEPLLTAILSPGKYSDLVVDHMWPQAKMSSDARIKKSFKTLKLDSPTQDSIDFFKGNYNRIANLQIIRNLPNNQKNDEFYDEWTKRVFPGENDRKVYFVGQAVPLDDQLNLAVDLSYQSFARFFTAREALLREKMNDYFGVDDSV